MAADDAVPASPSAIVTTDANADSQYEGSTLIQLPGTRHSFSLQYLKNRTIATAVRVPVWSAISLAYYVIDGPSTLKSQYGVQRRRISVPSRDKRRTIRADVYTPPNVDARAAVHINWHGSGFVIECFGADALMCSYLASKLNCVVIDADYRKAPEYPFPAGVQDAEDMCNYVLSNAELYDVENVSVGGCSAGANLSLAMGVVFGARLRAVTAIAPPCDFRPSARPKVAPEVHARALPPKVSLFFDSCYLVPTADRADPRLSPACADVAKDQLTCHTVFIAAGTGDTLHNDGENTVANLTKQGHKNAVFRAVPGQGHGFEQGFRGKGEQRETAVKVFDEMVQLIGASRTTTTAVRASL